MQVSGSYRSTTKNQFTYVRHVRETNMVGNVLEISDTNFQLVSSAGCVERGAQTSRRHYDKSNGDLKSRDRSETKISINYVSPGVQTHRRNEQPIAANREADRRPEWPCCDSNMDQCLSFERGKNEPTYSNSQAFFRGDRVAQRVDAKRWRCRFQNGGTAATAQLRP